uniref:Reeler domain containing 1 n=1 Tax=Pelusios castaneus TaxID=367368 RepID=A0A8C8R9J3_9SAUR
MKVQVVIIGWACTTLCLVSYTAAFSHGASLSACADMTPKHIRAQLQNPWNNYITIHTNMSFYFPGDKVPVTVRSTRDFMGFLLQARRVSNDQVAGTFVFIPPGSKLLTCFEDGDTVTHSDKSLKRNLSFVWKAPVQPIGDIKFFLSVVQSYFVYWVRIESVIVSHQTQNRTPASTKFTPARLIRIAVTEVQAPAFGSRQDTELLDNGAQPSESSIGSVALRAISRNGGGQANRSRTYSDPSLEPSLEFQRLDMANTLRSFILQDYTSSPSTRDGYCVNTECNVLNMNTMTLPKVMEGVNQHLFLCGTTSVHVASSTFLGYVYTRKSYVDFVYLSSASRQGADSLSVTQKASANFLLQSEHAVSGEEGEGDYNKEDVDGNTLPWVTRPIPEAVVPGKGGERPRKGTQFIAAQLGILLGCTAALGMALAAGLRCIHAQYCRKRTEVSFSEPANDVITMRDGGEVMQFRKIRENSFVLVQAEYNWISPSGSGKKTVI